MKSEMQSISHYGPSLGVAFSGPFVYAAYGPFLQIYKYATGEFTNKCLIFRKSKVHGVKIGDNGLILCYGSRSVSVVSIQDVHEKNSLVENERYTSEWIINGEFSYDHTQFYLLTCYDRVLTYDLRCNLLKKNAIYGERSMLYSGSIRVISPNKVFVNAGTVMGGIIVWELFTETLVANLLGHVGSIFYVSMSKNGSLVASCSDDRSVRLWDLNSQKELSIGWGHTARIWNLLFYNDDTRLVTVSEDCTCRVWYIQGGKLLQRAIYETNLTKNVWGVDVNEEAQLAVTTGNDGRLRMISLSEQKESESIFTLKKISNEAEVPFSSQEIIKGFHWFPFGLVVITSDGKILHYDNHWKFLMQDSRFRSYSMTSGITKYQVVIFSNKDCDLLMLKFDPLGKKIVTTQELHVDRLTRSHNCMVYSDYNDGEFLLALESPNPHDPFLCLKFDGETLRLKYQFEFKKPSSFSSSCLEIYGSHLLVGSRSSLIAVFDFNNMNQDPIVSRRLNPGDTITSIRFIELSTEGPIFIITNRDGYYNFIRIKTHSLKKELEVIHSNRTFRGSLEGSFCDNNGDLITYGFKSELFYVYNETKCYEKAVRVCGGAHRQWKLARTSDGLILVFIRASDIHLINIPEQSVPEILQCGTHGREIRDIAFAKDCKYKNGYLFCTGSEDTTIKLCHLAEDTGQITTYWTMRKHISGLQRCKFISQKFMISCSAREELFLWEITTSCNTKPYINLRQTLPVFAHNPNLRITDFYVKFEDSDFILATVYSDSAIKVWRYHNSQNRFQLLLEGYYKTCCILNVFLFELKNEFFLMISATDGHLSVYNITNAMKNTGALSLLPPINATIQIHQSSVKTMNVSIDDQKSIITVYTGGDDNALAICTFRWEEEHGRLVPQIEDIQRSAASSTITSSVLSNDGRLLITSSVDQQLRVWETVDNKLRLESQNHTTIADTGSLDIVEGLVLVGGLGISAWKIMQ